MAENVGGIYYEVDADTSGLLRAERDVDQSTSRMEKGFKDSSRETDKFGNSMGRLNPIARGVRQETNRLSGALSNVRKVAALAATALAAVGVVTGIRQAISDVANFEQALLGLRAVSGATAAQMEQLEAQARTLGATSSFSAQQAADAQKFLAQAGFDVNEILAATPGILQLATAAQMDLAQAADIASNVLGGMRMEVEELGRVNDVLAATAAGANTDVAQLGQALSFAAPFAAAAGISIEEASAAIGTLSDSGLQASRAGTGLVGVIRQLSRVTPQAERSLAKYGLSAEDVSIETHGLTAVLDTLRQANISTGDALEIFGTEAGAAAQILANGAPRVTEFADELRNAEGAAEDAAKILGSGLVGSMRSLQSALSESVLQLGDAGLSAALKGVIDTATGVISILNGMGDTFQDVNDISDEKMRRMEMLATAIRAVGNAVAILSAALAGRLVQSMGAAVVAMVAKTGATWTLNGALVALRTTLMTLFGPVGLIAGAVTALYLFRKELGLTGTQASNTARRLNQLTEALGTLTQQELRSNLASARMEMQRLSDQGQNLRRVLSRMNEGDTWDGRTYEELRQQLRDVREDAIAARDTVRTLEGALAEASDGVETTTVELEDLTTTLELTSGATQKTKEETEDLERGLRSLIDRLYPAEAALREYRRAQEQLKFAAATDEIDDLSDALRRLQNEFSTGMTGGFMEQLDTGGLLEEQQTYWEQWLEAAETAFADFDQMAANTAENFHRGFGNAFESMIFDSESAGDAMRGMMQSVARGVVNSLGQMAAQWLAYQAVQLLVGRTTQASAASTMAANASAQSVMAGLNAFTSTAAIPIVGPAMAPAAATAAVAATAPMAATVSSLAMAGMAHDGIDNVPKEGTWLLDKGERVVGADLNRDLGQFLEREKGGRSSGGDGGSRTSVNVNVNLIEDAERAGSVEQESVDDEEIINVFVASIASGGDVARAIEATYGVSRQGR